MLTNFSDIWTGVSPLISLPPLVECGFVDVEDFFGKQKEKKAQNLLFGSRTQRGPEHSHDGPRFDSFPYRSLKRLFWQ